MMLLLCCAAIRRGEALRDLVELFWFKYSQLQHAVRNGDEDLVSILDREIEPALDAVFRREARNAGELREQFQLMVDLLREECEDRACVLRQSGYIQSLLSRYFGARTSRLAALPFSGHEASRILRGVTEDGLLNEAILESLPDRVAVITTDYRYLYSNSANALHLNEKPIDLVGRHLIEFIGIQRFESRVKRHLDRCFAGETIEYNYISSRSSAGVTRCRMAPCRSNAKTVIGAILMLQDAAGGRGSIAA